MLDPNWSFSYIYNYTFYSRYNTVCIANTEIGLDLNRSVIKRLWCTKFRENRPAGSGEEDF